MHAGGRRNERGFASEPHLRFLTSWPARLRGALFRRPDASVFVFAPCRDVHTFGMRCALDVAFVSKEGVVLRAEREVGPRRRLRMHGASVVLERFSCAQPWFHEGDVMQVELSCEAQCDETARRSAAVVTNGRYQDEDMSSVQDHAV